MKTLMLTEDQYDLIHRTLLEAQEMQHQRVFRFKVQGRPQMEAAAQQKYNAITDLLETFDSADSQESNLPTDNDGA